MAAWALGRTGGLLCLFNLAVSLSLTFVLPYWPSFVGCATSNEVKPTALLAQCGRQAHALTPNGDMTFVHSPKTIVSYLRTILTEEVQTCVFPSTAS